MGMLPKRDQPDFQSRLNTYILCFGVASGLISVGYVLQQQVSNDKDTQNWIARHEILHKDRQAIIDSNSARVDERLRKLENDSLKLETLQYRVTVNEQTNVAVNRVLEELKVLVNDQGASIRVIREVLVPAAGNGVDIRRRK